SLLIFFFSSRRRHTRSDRDWSSDVCSSDLWELGNESDHKNYDGSPTAEEYGTAAARFARAMKRIDPSIRIGVNGPGHPDGVGARSEERRVGKEGRCRGGVCQGKKKCGVCNG